MPAQLHLDLERRPDHARAAFEVGGSNRAAVRALDGWPDWRGGALALVGPPGSGKSHLASVWMGRMGAVRLVAGAPAPGGVPLLIEDADRSPLAAETLFHLLNRAQDAGGGLLLTARALPGRWAAALPDLRSRLNALPVAELEAPDDAILGAILRQVFRQRNIRPSEELLAYLLRRIERSGEAAGAVVRRLDEAAQAAGRAVSRGLARQVLEEDGERLGE